MPIYRTTKNKNTPYVMAAREWIDAPGLSAKAKGILLYLLSKPDNWRVYERDIVAHMADGRDSVRAGLRELERMGYIVRTKQRAQHGRFGGVEYAVYETPITVDGFSGDGKSDTSINNIRGRYDFRGLDRASDLTCVDAHDRMLLKLHELREDVD